MENGVQYTSQEQLTENMQESLGTIASDPDNVEPKVKSPNNLTGYLSPLVVVVSVIACFYVVTEFESQEHNDYMKVVLSLLVIFVTLGIATVSAYIVLFFRYKKERINIHFPAKRLNRRFIIALGLMALAYYGLQVWNIGTCVHKDRGMGSLLIIYYSMLFVFTSIEMASLLQFVTTHPFQYKNNTHWMKNNVCKMIILTVNLCIWLNSHSVVKFSPVTHEGHTGSGEHDEDHHNLTKNDTSDSSFSACTTTEKFANFSSLFTIFHIGFLEFFLHSVSVFIEIWSEEEITEGHDEIEIDQGNAFIACNMPSWTARLILTPFFLLSTGFLIICIMQVSEKYNGLDLEFAHRMYDCSFGIVMLIVVIVFCVLLYGPVTRVYPYIKADLKANDYMYIGSYFGLIAHHVFQVHVGIYMSGKFRIIILGSVVYILLDSLQTIFLIKASKLAKETRVLQGQALRMVCLVLSRLNFGCWLRLTYCVAISIEVESREIEYFGELWGSYSGLFIPLTAYYRFMSVFRYSEIVGITSKKDETSDENNLNPSTTV